MRPTCLDKLNDTNQIEDHLKDSPQKSKLGRLTSNCLNPLIKAPEIKKYKSSIFMNKKSSWVTPKTAEIKNSDDMVVYATKTLPGIEPRPSHFKKERSSSKNRDRSNSKNRVWIGNEPNSAGQVTF